MKHFLFLLILISSQIFPQNFRLDNFVRLKKEKVPDWMTEQIESNFRPFAETGITLDGLEGLYQHLLSYPAHTFYRYLRIRVIDGVIYRHIPKDRPVVQDQGGFYTNLLTICRQAGDLPNVDFILHFNDGTPCQGVMPDLFWLRPCDEYKPCAPFCAFGKLEDGEKTLGLIHIPWNYSLLNHNRYIQAYKQVVAEYPWETRINQAIWRGEPSDLRIPEDAIPRYTHQELYDIYKTRDRYRVSEMALQHPNYIDAGFSSNRTNPLLNPFLAGMFKPWLPEVSNHMQYKYLICLDGWGWSNNFWWGLAWGAVCIKPEGGMTDWYYSALKPYHHFLPVKKDLSNLIEIIQWAQDHDDECKQIAENGRAVFHTEITNDHGLLYLYLVMKEYERLQKFNTRDLREVTIRKGSGWVRMN